MTRRNARPLAFRNPELAALETGLRVFRRLADGALADCKPGDLLWIREPYFLDRRYDGHRPTTALNLNARPTFLADVGFHHCDKALGRVHPARELCRPWHRRHLVVRRVTREQLRDITAADLAAAGYRDHEHFAELWNRDISMRGCGARWIDNPVVLRAEFDLVERPVPKPRKRKCQPQRTTPESRAAHRAEDSALRASWSLRHPAAALPPAEDRRAQATAGGSADQHTWCDQCQRRVSPAEGRSCASLFCDAQPAHLKRSAA